MNDVLKGREQCECVCTPVITAMLCAVGITSHLAFSVIFTIVLICTTSLTVSIDICDSNDHGSAKVNDEDRVHSPSIMCSYDDDDAMCLLQSGCAQCKACVCAHDCDDMQSRRHIGCFCTRGSRDVCVVVMHIVNDVE